MRILLFPSFLLFIFFTVEKMFMHHVIIVGYVVRFAGYLSTRTVKDGEQQRSLSRDTLNTLMSAMQKQISNLAHEHRKDPKLYAHYMGFKVRE
jgi:hypothetical protein